MRYQCQSYTHLTNCRVWGKSYRKLRRSGDIKKYGKKVWQKYFQVAIPIF